MKLILIYISPHFSLGNEELEVTEIVMLQFQLYWTCHGTQSFCKTGAFTNLSHNHSSKIFFNVFLKWIVRFASEKKE